MLAYEKKPLEVWRVTAATGVPEERIIAMLIRETEVRRLGCVTFRYPPLPCAAIVRIDEQSNDQAQR